MRLTKIFPGLALPAVVAAAQERLPVVRSNVSHVSIQDGETLKKDSWRLSPETKPDVCEADLINGRPHTVTFITDVASISFVVEEGKSYDFVIKRGEGLCYTRVVGRRFVPAAVFDVVEWFERSNADN